MSGGSSKSLENVDEVQDLTVMPNPTTGLLTVQHGPVSTGASIEVFNATGALIGRYAADTGGTTFLDLSEAPVGAYLLKLEDGERISTLRLVKE